MIPNVRWFRRTALAWYRAHGRRDLPWRKTRDPYKILVSEVMLQQTQVDRVKEKWPEFLWKFPTVKSLAMASAADVIRAWRGLGYNRRALYLQKAAHSVIERFNGKFPQTLEELQTLPGVGEYTARAMLVFAFGKAYIAPDVNVLRILRRSFRAPSPRWERDRVRALIAIGDTIVTPKTAYNLNQALMDLGRTICTVKNPKSALCPLHDNCLALDPIRATNATNATRVEPSFAGVPRRIWRGRIVELVRKKGAIRHDQLLHQLGIEFSRKSGQWLQSVIRQLANDGLLALRAQAITLP